MFVLPVETPEGLPFAKMLLFIQFKSFPSITKLLSIRDLFIKWVDKQLCLIFL